MNTEIAANLPRHKQIGNIVLINACVRICSQCGLAEPDASARCCAAPEHNWSY